MKHNYDYTIYIPGVELANGAFGKIPEQPAEDTYQPMQQQEQ